MLSTYNSPDPLLNLQLKVQQFKYALLFYGQQLSTLLTIVFTSIIHTNFPILVLYNPHNFQHKTYTMSPASIHIIIYSLCPKMKLEMNEMKLEMNEMVK